MTMSTTTTSTDTRGGAGATRARTFSPNFTRVADLTQQELRELLDLAAAMKVPVLAVAYNRLGCLNHSVLTVQNILGHGLRCVGLVLNSAQETGDIAVLTNADILKKILDVPLLCGLGENLTELPADWRLVLDSTIGS